MVLVMASAGKGQSMDSSEGTILGRRAGLKGCAVPLCGRLLPVRAQYMCDEHWLMVPFHLRAEIYFYALHEMYRLELLAARREAVAAVERQECNR